MKKVFLFMATLAMLFTLAFSNTTQKAYANTTLLKNTTPINYNEVMDGSITKTAGTSWVGHVDCSKVSSSLNVRQSPGGSIIGSLGPREELCVYGYRDVNGQRWALVKYWVGQTDSGTAKCGWVLQYYITEQF